MSARSSSQPSPAPNYYPTTPPPLQPWGTPAPGMAYQAYNGMPYVGGPAVGYTPYQAPPPPHIPPSSPPRPAQAPPPPPPPPQQPFGSFWGVVHTWFHRVNRYNVVIISHAVAVFVLILIVHAMLKRYRYNNCEWNLIMKWISPSNSMCTYSERAIQTIEAYTMPEFHQLIQLLMTTVPEVILRVIFNLMGRE